MVIFWIILGVVVGMFLFTVFFGAPYVPSRKRELGGVFEKLYKLKKDDLLVDVGSGDGVVLREVARHGVQGVGYEINPVLWLISKARLRKSVGVEVRLKNFLWAELPEETTVVYIFGAERLMGKIYGKLREFAREHKKTVWLISYGFEVSEVECARKLGGYFLYKIEGKQIRNLK